MMMILAESAPPRLRGRLALWLVEVRAGVYIGDYSERVRNVIWSHVTAGIEGGSAILAWAESNEIGYRLDVIGDHHRQPVDHDGIQLVAFKSDEATARQLLDEWGEDVPPSDHAEKPE